MKKADGKVFCVVATAAFLATKVRNLFGSAEFLNEVSRISMLNKAGIRCACGNEFSVKGRETCLSSGSLVTNA